MWNVVEYGSLALVGGSQGGHSAPIVTVTVAAGRIILVIDTGGEFAQFFLLLEVES